MQFRDADANRKMRLELAGAQRAYAPRVAEVAAHLSEEIRSDVPLYKAPVPVATVEPVVVASASDGLRGIASKLESPKRRVFRTAG